MGTLIGPFDLNIPVQPLICLLGYLDPNLYTPPFSDTMQHALFVACKQIALMWISLYPPTLSDWIFFISLIF